MYLTNHSHVCHVCFVSTNKCSPAIYLTIKLTSLPLICKLYQYTDFIYELQVDRRYEFFQVESRGALLTSCYLLLEKTISYMTGGPSLALDSKQLHQLHGAMVGAFNAVLLFLSEQQYLIAQPTIVIASVRALAAWIAEETTALKAEVVKLLPFLLNIG